MSFRFKSGDLNPSLIEFDNNVLADASMSQMGNGYSYTLAAQREASRPNVFRDMPEEIFAEVFAFGQEQGSFAKNLNFNLDPKDVKSNRVNFYWARIPEHSYQIDIYAPHLLIDGKPDPLFYGLGGEKFYDYQGLTWGLSDIVAGSVIEVKYLSQEDGSRVGLIENVLANPAVPVAPPPPPGSQYSWSGNGLEPQKIVKYKPRPKGGYPYPPANTTSWQELQTYGTAYITTAPAGICVAGPTFAPGQWPLFPVDGKLGQLDTDREPTSIDIGCPVGTPIYAAADGVLYKTDTDPKSSNTDSGQGLCGGTVVAKYQINGREVRQTYCHCTLLPDVPRNHPIKRGDVLALTGGEPGNPGAGNTYGPHVHISMGSRSDEIKDIFGWDFSKNNSGKTIVGKSSCSGD